MKTYKIKARKLKKRNNLSFKMFLVILKNCLFGWIRKGDTIKALKHFINIHIKFYTIRGYKNWNLGKRLSLEFFEYSMFIELRNVSNSDMCQNEYQYDNNI